MQEVPYAKEKEGLGRAGARKPAPKKKDYMIAVTEDEYDAHREELEKLDNVVIFVDDADRDHWMGAQWRLGVDLDPDI